MILGTIEAYSLLGLVDVQFRLKEFDCQNDWNEITVSLILPVWSPDDAERIARDLLRNGVENGQPLLQVVRWNVAEKVKGQVIRNSQSRYTKKHQSSLANYERR